jgi:hypothetical protein
MKPFGTFVLPRHVQSRPDWRWATPYLLLHTISADPAAVAHKHDLPMYVQLHTDWAIARSVGRV